MTRRSLPLIPALLLALALVVSACGSSDGSDGAADSNQDTPSTTVATSSDDGVDGEVTQTTGQNPGDATLAEGPATEENTVTWRADKTFDPATLEVEPGEVFTFKAAEDAGTTAVTFDGDQTYTISGGLTESFTLETPGTYTVSDAINGVTMTVIVGG